MSYHRTTVSRYLQGAAGLVVVHPDPDPGAAHQLPARGRHLALLPDGAPQEGHEDGRDVLDGSEDEGLSAAVDPWAEGQGALLALGEVAGVPAQRVRGQGQQGVHVVRAGEELVWPLLVLRKITYQEPIGMGRRSPRSRQGILMGMMPSSTKLRATWAPTGMVSPSLTVIWISMVTVSPLLARMGKGLTVITSNEAGSGLPSGKDQVSDCNICYRRNMFNIHQGSPDIVQVRPKPFPP